VGVSWKRAWSRRVLESIVRKNTRERERERERERGECEKGLNQGVADFTVWFVATCLDSCI